MLFKYYSIYGPLLSILSSYILYNGAFKDNTDLPHFFSYSYSYSIMYVFPYKLDPSIDIIILFIYIYLIQKYIKNNNINDTKYRYNYLK